MCLEITQKIGNDQQPDDPSRSGRETLWEPKNEEQTAEEEVKESEEAEEDEAAFRSTNGYLSRLPFTDCVTGELYRPSRSVGECWGATKWRLLAPSVS